MLSPGSGSERGNVMVTAILLMAIMLGTGLAVAAQVDTQTAQSREERERESSFNLTEAALSAQTFILGRRGTGTKANPYPTECDRTTSGEYFCPSDEQLMRNYDDQGQVDFGPGTTWKTHVRDDADSSGTRSVYWRDGILDDSTWPRYDANGNRHVWVRAQAEVRGELRAIVAWVRIEDRPVSFPRYAVLSGYVDGTNAGGHGGRPLVNSTGSLGLGVRCGTPPESSCIDLDPDKGPQLQPPDNYILNYSSAEAITLGDLHALEEVAIANGTYYDTCPDDPNGEVVVVESGDCLYNNSTPAAEGQQFCCNTEQEPGLYIQKRGTVELTGNIEFWGVIYHPNLDGLGQGDGPLVETSGTSAVRGGVLVDGGGGIYAGSSGDNIVYESLSFDNINAVGTAGVVQNTWREIVSPQER